MSEIRQGIEPQDRHFGVRRNGFQALLIIGP